MPEFFLELFSEEIPARMQHAASGRLIESTREVLAPLRPRPEIGMYFGPRRLALAADIAAEVPETLISERGPRILAPEQALAGFLRKHSATKENLIQEGDFWVLNKQTPSQSAKDFIAAVLPEALAKLPWPKSMRWGQSGDFTWVRPLRRIVCLLDGEIIPIKLGPVTASNETEGHRVHAPGAFPVSSAAVWEEKLREHYVFVNQDERRQKIVTGLAEKAAELGLTIVPDEGLLDEVTGLVEWPVPMIGKINESFMDLPPEVRELSMKVNQKYFALRDAAGNPAPYFAFVANLAAEDSGQAIIAGNERVLRARLSDARHFWDQDLKTPLNEYLPKLEKITFHAKIGTQRQRADRIAKLAQQIATAINATGEERIQAKWAGLLCKADLVTGMVGEFPELQGIMGGYYAEKRSFGWDNAIVGQAIKTHYQPKGPSDAVPTGLVAVSVALADKLDTLVQFFKNGEKPTGSGDPYALRRCALGVIRIILENELRLPLKQFLNNDENLFDFIIERLRVKLRGEGKRFDILDAVLAASVRDDDLVKIMKKVEALEILLTTEDGRNLLVGYKRAANILKIESAKDGPHPCPPNWGQFVEADEINLGRAIAAAQGTEGMMKYIVLEEDYGRAMQKMAMLRPAIDAFFERVTINAEQPELRLNRLRLLAQFTDAVNLVADFSKIEA